MRDVRDLVPRDPPEGLFDWTRKTCRDALARGGLVYKAEYVTDYELYQLLDEFAPPKKKKMVRVTCSVCGEFCYLDWAKDSAHGYGFVLPDNEGEDWGLTVTSDGDDVSCPMCGEPVRVIKRASIRDHRVTAEYQVMSAHLVGEENLLALTGWTVQRRVFKSGAERLKFIPAEAYVFSAGECAQLMGWQNGYSGYAGYFIQYGRAWSQPRDWAERWGREDRIFGLTPELIAASCLPHCKLDEYMRPRPGAVHYPVLYLRLYQERPNVESLLLHGLPRVLDGLLDREYKTHNHPFLGRSDIPEIDWAQRRPAQMLHLTKEELRMARGQDWGVLFWELFRLAKAAGEILNAEDIQNAFCLGDENVGLLAGRGPVAKSIRYLLRQCEFLPVEPEDEDPPPVGIPDVQTLLDYWTMAEDLGRDLGDPAVRFPPDLIAAHDEMADLTRMRKDRIAADQFRVRRRILGQYTFAADGLLIRPAASQAELVKEGRDLHHCVGTYARRHAEGETAIFFIRRRARPSESYYTLELDEKTLTVRQNRGKYNCDRTAEIEAFEALWLSWLKASAPRDERGKPVLPEKSSKKGAA